MTEEWVFGEILGQGSLAAVRWQALAQGWLEQHVSPSSGALTTAS